ncbi:MAG: hypothetical protein JWO31_653 [Phycisphaerales bacterium]|nr:hypothetical protein [Phycisphaerales bacterium]
MSRDRVVVQLRFTPGEPDGLILPLWAVYPHHTSVTIFWRMGSGEHYKHKWHAWYRGLTDAGRSEYQRRFPAPTDPERAWEGWYEAVADRPAGNEHPLADFIAGRV